MARDAGSTVVRLNAVGVEGRTLLKILDFGLAKMRGPDPSESGNLTAVGTVMGTRAYMSPEQLQGQEVDQRTDIFALGVMVLECLTGHNPLRERNAAERTPGGIVCSLLEGDAPAIQALNAALGKCLAEDSHARFPTVAAMQEALIPLIRGCPRCHLAGSPRSGEDTSAV